jgi:hypothetical protein
MNYWTSFTDNKISPKKLSIHDAMGTKSIETIGQKLYNLAGISISSKGMAFGKEGSINAPIGDKWGASGWYKKQNEGTGFNKSNYNFGFGLTRSF